MVGQIAQLQHELVELRSRTEQCATEHHAVLREQSSSFAAREAELTAAIRQHETETTRLQLELGDYTHQIRQLQLGLTHSKESLQAAQAEVFLM